jgi:hypothetical protein
MLRMRRSAASARRTVNLWRFGRRSVFARNEPMALRRPSSLDLPDVVTPSNSGGTTSPRSSLWLMVAVGRRGQVFRAPRRRPTARQRCCPMEVSWFRAALARKQGPVFFGNSAGRPYNRRPGQAPRSVVACVDHNGSGLHRNAAGRLGEGRQAGNLQYGPVRRFTGRHRLLPDNSIAISMDGKDASGTTCSSSGCGAASSTRKCI